MESPAALRRGGAARAAVAPLLALAATLGVAYAISSGYAPEAVRGGVESARAALADPAARAHLTATARGHLDAAARVAADIKAMLVVPLLRAAVSVTALFSAMVAADRLYHYYTFLYWKRISKTRPEERFVNQPLPDMVTSGAEYPPVVVQLPMFNEREVCQNVIDACCEMTWPREKLLVQILDDSTDAVTRERIEDKVAEWREKGVRVEHRWRETRTGYKAGAMSDAMPSVAGYDYIAVFDADFHPAPDFLLRTVHWLHNNPGVGFVQARWVYANGSETMLTRVQEISLNFHIKCEQYSRFAAGAFFNFNGTAGVWRREAIERAGGWNCRTTVEDMDLSLRAYLAGYRFVFLYDVTVLNEIPSNYDAYRKQQHRWSCGPMQLWRKSTAAVWASGLPWSQKLYLNVFFFGTRMFATHIVSFALYCGLVPLSVIAPEIHIPAALVYIPLLVTASTVAFTPGGWPHLVAYLYENAMSIVRISAMWSGLLELSDAHEWVVTSKLGGWAVSKAKAGMAKVGKAIAQACPKAAPTLQKRKLYKRELAMAALFFAAASHGVAARRWQYALFLLLQGSAFLAFGLSCGMDAQTRSCL